MWSVRGLRGGGGVNRPVAGAVCAAVEALERRVLLDAVLSGMVWQDTSGNGVRDGGEPVISGRTIYLDSNLNRLRDSGELFTTTNGSGIYTFAALPSGPYYVAQELPVGWEPTSPAPHWAS